MRNLFVLLARYNGHANRALFELLLRQAKGSVKRPFGSYYGSVLGLLNHALVSDLGWLDSDRNSNDEFRSLESSIRNFVRPAHGLFLYDELDPLWSRRRHVDHVFEAFAEELTEDQQR